MDALLDSLRPHDHSLDPHDIKYTPWRQVNNVVSGEFRYRALSRHGLPVLRRTSKRSAIARVTDIYVHSVVPQTTLTIALPQFVRPWPSQCVAQTKKRRLVREGRAKRQEEVVTEDDAGRNFMLLLFHCNKVVITGARREQDIPAFHLTTTLLVSKQALRGMHPMPLHLQNAVYTTRINGTIDVAAYSRDMDPLREDTFPGAKVSVDVEAAPQLAVIIFPTGSVNVIGVKRKDEALALFDAKFLPLIRPYVTIRSE